MSSMFSVTDEIRMAASRIMDYTVRTPFHSLNREDILFKREDLQTGGSFKIRGVANFLLSAGETTRRNGLVTVSTGNTGCALCMIGAKFSAPVHVFVLEDCEPAKIRRIERAGGTVHVAGRSFSTAGLSAQEFASTHGMLFCSSAADWNFVYGVATISLEIHEESPDLDVIFVPIGGGGLAAGLGTGYEGLRKDGRPQIIGVQSSRCRPIYELFHHGHIISELQPTAAMCLAGEPEHGAIILEIGQRILSDIVVVSDEEIQRATEILASQDVFVEPGAAAGYAAYLRYGSNGDRTGVILTGADLN